MKSSEMNFSSTDLCSHVRVYNLFAESITHLNAFASKKCIGTTIITQSNVTCSELEATSSGKMGFHAATTLTGNFLETNEKTPYTRS